jgi:hypothetical protein
MDGVEGEGRGGEEDTFAMYRETICGPKCKCDGDSYEAI